MIMTRERLKFHESWIVRAAVVAALIMTVAFGVVAKMALDGLDAVAKIAHDEEVASALSDYLDKFKDMHQLQQELITQHIASALARRGIGPALDEQAVRDLLTDAKLPDWSEWKSVRINIASYTEEAIDQTTEKSPIRGAAVVKTPLNWLDKESLQIGNFVVAFPKGNLFAQFKAAEITAQKYQVLGVSLRERIQPSLVRAYGTAFAGSFLLLVAVLAWLAYGFRAKLASLLDGFIRWSDGDDGFRFRGKWPGELRLVAHQFNRMADEVEANRRKSLYLEKIASWQIIARKLAHEIKNPLTPIQMIVSQLKRHYKGEDQEFQKLLENATGIVTVEVAALRRLVDDFSNFARLPIPKRVITDIRIVAQQAMKLEQAAFPSHRFSLRADEGPITGEFDGELLRQVFINLMKNAAEACGDHGAEIAVDIRESETQVEVSVIDSGPGIPQDVQERIFEAYFSTKNTGPSPGMGLGLAITQKIVIDHEGSIKVESIPGRTVFRITLPKRAKHLS